MMLQRLVFILIFFNAACVSVSLPKDNNRNTNPNVSYTEPKAPFSKHLSPGVDAAWKNDNTGSIISYLSDCSTTYDPTLEAATDEVVQGILEQKVLKQNKISYQGREALQTQLRGRVDGVDSSIDITVFKKNGCLYILNLVASPLAIEGDRSFFENFLKGFRAP